MLASNYLPIATLSDFEESDLLLRKHDGRSILLLKDGAEVRAVDNRCPHMGFPLSKGTLNDGILTCHWHHARFDAKSGCAFDLWADDIPAYDVRIQGEEIQISNTPRKSPSVDYYKTRLHQGMEQNISIIIYKSLAGLLAAGITPKEIFSELAAFGSSNHDKWADGMTLLVLTANLWEILSSENRYIAISKAAMQLASNCAGQPARRKRAPLDSAQPHPEQIRRWMRNWSASRHRDAIERSSLTLINNDASIADLQCAFYDAIYDRVYSDTGHNADFTNKALELSQHLGFDSLKNLIPLTSRLITEAMGEEEKGGWRNPIDLVPILKAAEQSLENVSLESKRAISTGKASDLHSVVLGDDPQAIVDTLVDALREYSPVSVARELCLLAFGRLARFPESNELSDWFNPAHSAIHANAVYQTIARSASFATCRGLLHTALAIYQDRYLNLPSPSLPHPQHEVVQCFKQCSDWETDLLSNLDRKQPWHAFPTNTVAAFRAGKPMNDILNTLAKAVLREDFDFHKFQIIEAAASQVPLARDSSEVELILSGVARHTAAHAPTPREQHKLILIARRLQRGDDIQPE